MKDKWPYMQNTDSNMKDWIKNDEIQICNIEKFVNGMLLEIYIVIQMKYQNNFQSQIIIMTTRH